jgi:hypothetical protein
MLNIFETRVFFPLCAKHACDSCGEGHSVPLTRRLLRYAMARVRKTKKARLHDFAGRPKRRSMHGQEDKQRRRQGEEFLFLMEWCGTVAAWCGARGAYGQGGPSDQGKWRERPLFWVLGSLVRVGRFCCGSDAMGKGGDGQEKVSLLACSL